MEPSFLAPDIIVSHTIVIFFRGCGWFKQFSATDGCGLA